MKIFGEKAGVVSYFSHMAPRIEKVSGFKINPCVQPNVYHSYANDSARMLRITITLNGQKLSLCNIYAPNDQVNQLQFIQELNNSIIDKSELTSLIAKRE